MSELIATVHVTDADGNDQTFSPGDTVPDWAAKQITNPKAWYGGSEMKAAGVDSSSIPDASSAVKKLAEPQKRGPGRPAKNTPAESDKE